MFRPQPHGVFVGLTLCKRNEPLLGHLWTGDIQPIQVGLSPVQKCMKASQIGVPHEESEPGLCHRQEQGHEVLVIQLELLKGLMRPVRSPNRPHASADCM